MNGVWKEAKNYFDLVDPLNGDYFLNVPDTQVNNLIEKFFIIFNKDSRGT